MGILKNKKYLFFCWLLFLPACALGLPSKENYPHWNLSDQTTYQKLTKIDQFIEKNKDQGLVAIFDWDGTLYNEEIPLKHYEVGEKRIGQPAWRIWAAYHLNDPKYPNLYPMYRTEDGNSRQHIAIKDDYFEGKTNFQTDDFGTINSIMSFEAGMTREEMDHAVRGYLKDYPAKNNAFFPILDLMQHMVDTGFNVWIVTGSNPYYVSSVLHNIEQNIDYRRNQKYHFGLSSIPYNINTGHIVGNAAMLSKSGRFTLVYNNRFVKDSGDNKIYVVDGIGKYIAIKTYIEKYTKKPAVFYAGNSGGDFDAINYILGKKTSDVMSVAVNPRGTLNDLVAKYPEKIVVVPVKY